MSHRSRFARPDGAPDEAAPTSPDESLMSTGTEGGLSARELYQELQKARSEAAKYRHRLRDVQGQLETVRQDYDRQLKEAQAELVELAEQTEAMAAEFDEERTTLTGERDEWQQQAESLPEDIQATIEDLTGKVRTFKHEQAFQGLHEDPELTEKGFKLRKELDVQKLWKLLGYTPESDDVDLAAVKGQIAALRESDPYLFEQPTQAVEPQPAGRANGTAQPAREPLTTGLDRGRGAPVQSGAGKVKVTQDQLGDPHWTYANRAVLADPSQWEAE